MPAVAKKPRCDVPTQQVMDTVMEYAAPVSQTQLVPEIDIVPR